MRAISGIEAGTWKSQALQGTAVDEVLRNDLIDILELDVAVPDDLGIDGDRRSMLALV